MAGLEEFDLGQVVEEIALDEAGKKLPDLMDGNFPVSRGAVLKHPDIVDHDFPARPEESSRFVMHDPSRFRVLGGTATRPHEIPTQPAA